MNAPVWRACVAAGAAIVCLLLSRDLGAADEPPYIGAWSNGRGETLVVTANTIRFGDDRALPFRDVTRATDGSAFELQITSRGEAPSFAGKTLGVECDDDSMKITAYVSHAAYMQAEDPQSVVTWFKDDESEADE